MAVVIESIGDKSESGAAGTTLTVDNAAGVAVGNLLILHASKRDSSINTPTGWTEIRKGTAASNISSLAAYKIADSGDAAAGSFSLDFGGTSGTDRWARIYRISGHNPSNPINVSNVGTATSATVTVATMTPTVGECLFLFLVAADALGAARTASGYAFATNDPTWTEQYDEQFAGGADNAQSSGASATRTQTTATGNCTATLNGSDDNVGIVLGIEIQVVNVTVSPAVIVMNGTVQAPTVTGSANVSPAVITMTSSVQAPTVSTAAAKWVTTNKSSAPNWTNPDKS